MSRFLSSRAQELKAQQAEEDRWGQHPECPVEVLPDGSQVWRVPPGTRVHFEVPGVYDIDVYILRPDGPVLPAGEPWHVAIRYADAPDEGFWWADWRSLRRIGYTAAARDQDDVQAAHATR